MCPLQVVYWEVSMTLIKVSQSKGMENPAESRACSLHKRRLSVLLLFLCECRMVCHYTGCWVKNILYVPEGLADLEVFSIVGKVDVFSSVCMDAFLVGMFYVLKG